MTEFKIGDRVRVVNSGEYYTRASGYAENMGLTNYHIDCIATQLTGEVINCNLNHVTGDILVAFREDGTDNEFIIGHTGLELIEDTGVNDYPNPPHVHRDLIIAWANGAEIQQLVKDEWKDTNMPYWYSHLDFRIKPQESEETNKLKKVEMELRRMIQEVEQLKEKLNGINK